MFGDVQSANIVGYKTDATLDEYGFKHIMFTFDDVGTENKFSISNLKGAFVIGDNIQIFDENGDLKEQIEWKKKGKEGWFYTMESTSSAAEHQFDRGLSVWLSTSAPVDFTVSGQVNEKGMDVDVAEEYAFTQSGNPFPTTLKLSALTFENPPAIGDNIQIFDENGDLVEQIEWKKKGKEGWFYTMESTSSAAEHEFAPGAAFWFSFGAANTVHYPTLDKAQGTAE